MKSSTIDMLRAYLMTASLAAMSIEIAALVSLELFGVPAYVFTSTIFRVSALSAIIGAVLVTKHVANVAYRSAVAHHYATSSGSSVQRVVVSPTCPGRMLVILHLHFNRRMVDPARC
jgi:hypothetical protein